MCLKKQCFPSLKLIVWTRHQKLVKISKQHFIYYAKILQDTECVVEWGSLTQLLLSGIILKHCILTLVLTYLPSRHNLLRMRTYPNLVQIFRLDMIQLTFNGKEIVYCAPLKIQVAVATNFKWINCTKQFKGYWIGTVVNKLKSLSTTHKNFSKKNITTCCCLKIPILPESTRLYRDKALPL